MAQPATEATASSLTVERDEAVPNFPDGVAFALDATAATPIERVELLYAAAGQETLNLVTPDHVPGTEVAVEHQLDLRGGALPPGVDVEYRWRLLDAAGNATETEPRTVFWRDDRFDWDEIAGDRVRVYAYAGDDPFNQAVLETAERTLDRLEPTYGARLVDPVRIWVYASPDDFAGALRPNTEPWIGGAAYPVLGLIHAVLPTAEAAEIGRVVPHEVSHVLLHQATRNPFNTSPNWLDEGLATYAQEVADPAYPDLVRAAATEGRLESVRTLNAQFPYDAEGARLAYAQSLSLVEHILDVHGTDGMARLIAVFREGVSFDDAVRRALGISLDELDAEWRGGLDARDPAPGAFTGAADERDDGGGLGLPEAALLASSALIMAVVALLALVAGTVAIRRGRLPPDPLDAEA
ncbi:MAG: peptidase MA family metallohydrolase [Chloroflexota bacterium]|nr:peptidase MA family metallohydrolase [Chloroflexota bacterium]